MGALSILVPALGIAVLILMLVEARRWTAGRHIVSRRQMGVRLMGGALLLALLSAIFVGLFILGLNTPRGQPGLFIAWWGGCMGGALALAYLALADLRHVGQRRREREHEIWREFARTLAERMRGDRGNGQSGVAQ